MSDQPSETRIAPGPDGATADAAAAARGAGAGAGRVASQAASEAAPGVDKVDVTAVNAKAVRTLYKAREPIYPKLVAGPFRSFKFFFLIVALGIYYGLPWLRWPRALGEPDQAVLVDFEGRRFYFFFIEIWPQEVYYITGLLIVAALSLFLVTALFGRVWCGYACPQTVWTDLFIAVERFIEGDRNKRMKLDKQPWGPSKISKKVSKHLIWLLIAFATGGAWILYFHDAPSLARDFFIGQAPVSSYLFAGILTFTTYSLAGMMREQVCTYMCPWPRIQAAMTDAETFQVTYRHDRGEPRGPHRKGATWEGRGDCVDCRQCVVACPMGIDIRDGDQLECINCALCIDACDSVMRKVGRPTGLIAYDNEANIERRLAGKKGTFHPVRARTVVYAGALALVCAVMLYGLSSRATLELTVLRDRNPNYVTLSDGSVRNGYELKIVNKSNNDRDVRLDVTGVEGLSLKLVGEGDITNPFTLTAPADRVESFKIYVALPPEALTSSSLSLDVTVTALADGEVAANTVPFQTGIAR